MSTHSESLALLRPHSSATQQLLRILPLLIFFLLIPLVIGLASDRPAVAAAAFFRGPFSSGYALGNMLSQTGLLLLTGLGAVIAFRVGSFNLGGEGQVASSAAAAAATGLFLTDIGLSGPAGILGVLLAGTAAGATAAAVSGVAKKWWNADELITSFLIGAALIPLADYLVKGPLFDPQANLLRTPFIAEGLRMQSILPPSMLTTAFVVAFLTWLLLTLYIDYGRLGSRLLLVGTHPGFAANEGLPVASYRAGGFILSGALHGMVGGLLVAGVHFAGMVGFSAGLGWNGIAVALIAANRPKRLLPAALFFSFVIAGTRQALVLSNLNLDITTLLQALVFLLITARLLRGSSGGTP